MADKNTGSDKKKTRCICRCSRKPISATCCIACWSKFTALSTIVVCCFDKMQNSATPVEQCIPREWLNFSTTAAVYNVFVIPASEVAGHGVELTDHTAVDTMHRALVDSYWSVVVLNTGHVTPRSRVLVLFAVHVRLPGYLTSRCAKAHKTQEVKTQDLNTTQTAHTMVWFLAPSLW